MRNWPWPTKKRTPINCIRSRNELYINYLKRGNGLTYGPIKLRHMQDFFSYYIRQQTILVDVTAGCQSNGRRVCSISDHLAPAAKAAPAGPPTPASRGRLCCRAGLSAPYYSHRWPGHPSTHPHPMLFCGDGSLTPQSNQ